MNCRKANNLLSAYLDGELAGVEQLQVREHLRQCDDCRFEYESLLCTKRLLANLALRDPRPQFEECILRRLAEERTPVAARLDWRAWWLLLTNPQRHRLRILAFSGAFSIFAALVAVQPYRASGQNGELGPVAASAPTFSSASAQPWPPIQQYRYLHDPWENAPTGGATITTVGTSSGIAVR